MNKYAKTYLEALYKSAGGEFVNSNPVSKGAPPSRRSNFANRTGFSAGHTLDPNGDSATSDGVIGSLSARVSASPGFFKTLNSSPTVLYPGTSAGVSASINATPVNMYPKPNPETLKRMSSASRDFSNALLDMSGNNFPSGVKSMDLTSPANVMGALGEQAGKSNGNVSLFGRALAVKPQL